MHGSSGCLGCYNRPRPLSTMEEPPKQLSIERGTGKKPSISGDLWSTSTGDMDTSAVQSQGSISSISTSNQTLDGTSNTPPEFVNHGLLLWNQTRQRWVGNGRPEKRVREAQVPQISSNATYENLLGSNKPFPQPIPLPEMVEFLVDVWEQEGMYD